MWGGVGREEALITALGQRVIAEHYSQKLSHNMHGGIGSDVHMAAHERFLEEKQVQKQTTDSWKHLTIFVSQLIPNLFSSPIAHLHQLMCTLPGSLFIGTEKTDLMHYGF